MGTRWMQISTFSMRPRSQPISEITTITTTIALQYPTSRERKPMTTLLSSSCSFTVGDKRLGLTKRQTVYRKWKCLALEEERSRSSISTRSVGSAGKLSREQVSRDKKKGTVAGAVALIIGNCIGSGILALPKKAFPAGVIPSSITMVVCWAFLLIEALLLVEVNVNLRKKRMRPESKDELDVLSIRTMAQETLGGWGGTFATITYVFLGYTSMIAYCSKSGEILFHLINLPSSVSGFFFTILFAMLISLGGTQATDRVNQWLTASMIGLLLAIEGLAVAFGDWSEFGGNGDWEKVPATIPVMIFSLVYHDATPVICAYLGSDLKRIRNSILLGSLIPLLALLMWDAIALGLSIQDNQVTDPVDMLLRVSWSGVPLMFEAFSLLAVGTSLIGTLMAFSEFFKEQLNNVWLHSPSVEILQKQKDLFGMSNWWERKKINFMSMAMVVAPSLIVSTTVPDAFSAATDICGGYCMTMLYGVLPSVMAWAMHNKNSVDTDQNALSRTRPAILGVGLLACGIVLEQLIQDILVLNP